jgi:DNA helicase II / ATP-dependent DNA helicase PcrA
MPDPGLSPAEEAADAAQLKVNACIDGGRHFRLEAGAGAGKTYSLVEALKRLIAERGAAYIQNGKKVACITYTVVARDEIASEIDRHPAIVVDTIHGFCWGFMSRFQTQLRELIPQIPRNAEKVAEAGGLGMRRVEYSLGFFGIEEDVVTLYHDDVPELMAKLLAYEKFRRLFVSAYPVLFIDEYQDTDRDFFAAIAMHFLGGTDGPLVGLFGDHWQTIYNDNFELIDYPNLVGIDKGANFRSVPAVVDVLNQLRPSLKQAVRDPNAAGEARVFHTNAYVGSRTNTSHSKEDLPADLARKALAILRAKLTADGWDFSPAKTKVLMLTHNALGEELGYPTIVEVFKKRKEAFSKKEDRTIAFLLDVVEPMCRAYDGRRYGEMFHILGRPQSIKSHADKERWKSDIAALGELRLHGKVGAVLDHLKGSARPRVPDPVVRRESELAAFDPAAGIEEPSRIKRQRDLRDVPYTEVIELAKFVDGSTPFATQHSVKGAEFENVLTVFGGGWNQYNWPRMLELMHTGKLTTATGKGFYRARNLFYVELSRPKQRLAVLFTQTLPANAMATVERLFQKDNVYTLTL